MALKAENKLERNIMNTQDLSEFGYRELDEAGTLLKVYANNPHVLDGSEINIRFNMFSGNVFLVDEYYNVAMMNEGNLELFYSCPICGHEGFLDEMGHNEDDEECQEYLKQIKGE